MLRRINKPANPLLGETFEFEANDYKCFSEQVSHHPPITALYYESKYAKVDANTSMKLMFWGRSIELTLKSPVFVDLINEEKGIHDRYQMNFPKASVVNMIIGTMKFSFYGDVNVINLDTNNVC